MVIYRNGTEVSPVKKWFSLQSNFPVPQAIMSQPSGSWQSVTGRAWATARREPGLARSCYSVAGGQMRQEDMPVAGMDDEPGAAFVVVAGTEVVGAVEDASGKTGLHDCSLKQFIGHFNPAPRAQGEVLRPVVAGTTRPPTLD